MFEPLSGLFSQSTALILRQRWLHWEWSTACFTHIAGGNKGKEYGSTVSVLETDEMTRGASSHTTTERKKLEAIAEAA